MTDQRNPERMMKGEGNSARDLTFRHEFMNHFRALEQAINRTQPLAEYAGNFDALLALVNLKKAAETILVDVERILDRKEA